MANADRPGGFSPYGRIGQTVVFEAGSACYPGDFVALASDGQVDPVAAGAVILGLCLDYASAAGDKVRVITDPEQLYVGQASATQIDAQTDVGNNCDIVATAGNSTYKASRQEIDSSTIAAAAAQLLIVGLDPAVNNAFGEFAKVIVKINEHQFKDAYAGV